MPSAFAWPFPKHSPYLDIFNFYLNEFFERGQWDAIKSRYEPQPQICPSPFGEPIERTTCVSAFLCLIGGIFIAMGVMSLECSFKKYLLHTKYFDPNKQEMKRPTSTQIEENDPIKSENITDGLNIINPLQSDWPLEKLIAFCNDLNLGNPIQWTISEKEIHFIIYSKEK